MMDECIVSVLSPAKPRRITRVTAGKHSNIHNLPKSNSTLLGDLCVTMFFSLFICFRLKHSVSVSF